MQNVMQALYLTRNARGLPASARRYKSIPEAVGYKDEKSFYSVFRRFAGCSMREYQQRLNLSQRKEKHP